MSSELSPGFQRCLYQDGGRWAWVTLVASAQLCEDCVFIDSPVVAYASRRFAGLDRNRCNVIYLSTIPTSCVAYGCSNKGKVEGITYHS